MTEHKYFFKPKRISESRSEDSHNIMLDGLKPKFGIEPMLPAYMTYPHNLSRHVTGRGRPGNARGGTLPPAVRAGHRVTPGSFSVASYCKRLAELAAGRTTWRSAAFNGNMYSMQGG